jgi:hypothetical protein
MSPWLRSVWASWVRCDVRQEVYLQAQARPGSVSEMRFGRHRSTSSYLQRKCIYKLRHGLEVYLQAQLFHGFGQCLSFSGSVTAGTNLSLVRSHEVVHSYELGLSLQLQGTRCNCIYKVYLLFLIVVHRGEGGDAASRRGEECVCNITSCRRI